MLLDPTCGDRGIVSLLVKNVDARLSTWPGVEESYWNGNHGDQCFGEVRRDSDGGYFFETVRARVLPFSPEIVEKVTWRSMCKGGSHVLFQVSEVSTFHHKIPSLVLNGVLYSGDRQCADFDFEHPIQLLGGAS